MNKNILIGSGLIVVLGVFGFYVFYKASSNSTGNIATSTAAAHSTGIVASHEPAAQPSALRVPFSDAEFLGKEEHTDTFTVATGSKVTTVNFVKNRTNSGMNPAYDVYIDGQKLDIKPGIVGGYSFSMLTTSPDKRYLAVRSASSDCANCTAFSLYIVDLLQRKLIVLDPPHSDIDFSGDRKPYQSIVAYFSYTWNPDDSINMAFFYVGKDKASVGAGTTDLYRISPIEIWNYNPATGSRSLLQTK